MATRTPDRLKANGLLPTILVFDAKGRMVAKVTGTITETELLEALRKALGEQRS